MKHFMPILIKFIVSFLILSFFLTPFGEISFLDILLTTAILVTLTYFAGDKMLLPRTNYILAGLFDFLFNFATIAFIVYILTNLKTGFLMPSLFAAVAITVFEVFFHLYLVKNIFPDRPTKANAKTIEFQTEYSEELIPNDKNND